MKTMDYRRDDMRVLDKAYALFDDANSMSSDRFRKKLVRTLADEEFLMAIFK